jgi:DNA repair exonuclease SbcCD nuclease subunit
MNFVHIADMHFDIPFTTLSKNDLGNTRRLDQREAFRKIIEYIKQNEIDYFFICGDLYEHEYVKQTTIEYINNCLKEIPNTKVYMVPGNHDPKVKNSYYAKFNWNENVHIFGPEIEKFSEDDVDIYGYGFDNFYMKNTKTKDIKIENPNKINIFLTHGSIDGGYDELREYNPMKEQELKQLGFDYIALGHIHKPYYNNYLNQNIIYPGSTIALGFDELGSHGMIVGNIDENKKLEIAFVPVDKKEFEEVNLPVDEIFSKEELIEIINAQDWNENRFYKIILTGKRNFEIEILDILKYVTASNVIKIKDETTLKIDLEIIAKEESLRGIFVRNLLAKKTEENEEQILKAIEIGLEAM